MKKFYKCIARYAGFYCGGLCFLLFASCFGGCEHYLDERAGAEGTVSILSWNVQALYDGKDDGWEYAEYRELMTQEKFEARLTAIADGLANIGGTNPDVIAFIEIENKEILEKLSTEYLTKFGYKYCFFARTRGNSLGIGIISRFPFTRAITHSINSGGSVIPRPIVEAAFKPGGSEGEEITLLVCHWKSKLGGDAETEKARREAAKVIIRRQREILAVNPVADVLVLGDLNENFDEFYRQSGEIRCALLPDDPSAARLAGFAASDGDFDGEDGRYDADPPCEQDFLILSEVKPPLSSFFENCDNVFYSPWFNEMEKGSYFYGGEWETIDHFLLNPAFFDKRGWQFYGAYVIDAEPFANSKGEPAAYNIRTGSGLSDHLPILLKICKR